MPPWADFRGQPRDQTVAFALFTTSAGLLKLTAQLFPLLPDETRTVHPEVDTAGKWTEIAQAEALEPGWAATFRVVGWDNQRDVRYRVRHGAHAQFEGLIRHDPVERTEIAVALFSCNSNRDRGDRASIVQNVRLQNPDLLAFVGDQSYDHMEHTAAFIKWGRTFADVIRDRPVITIPDDHDIGQGNLWGENGIIADSVAGDSGGYYYPAWYVNMVQRAQCSHLPDPYDPRPVEQGITVYYTALNVGGIDFAILEDRKFKSGPKGKIPQLGPRADHVNDPSYDPASIDLPGLQLLGERQMEFLKAWGRDWRGARMKAVISQTGFANAAHLHGPKQDRLLADLDSNGWPQSGRNAAIDLLRRAFAIHLGGDQHLATVVQHGITDWRDGNWSFVGPATYNNYYERAWSPLTPPLHPLDQAVPGLPHLGDYRDGFGNKITMHAYANPQDAAGNRADGYGLIRFNKGSRTITLECWPRLGNLSDGTLHQYPGWPIAIRQSDNDGRAALGWLPRLRVTGAIDPVVEVLAEDSGELLYSLRIAGDTFAPKVFAPGRYRLRVGIPELNLWQTLEHLAPAAQAGASDRVVKF